MWKPFISGVLGTIVLGLVLLLGRDYLQTKAVIREISMYWDAPVVTLDGGKTLSRKQFLDQAIYSAFQKKD